MVAEKTDEFDDDWIIGPRFIGEYKIIERLGVGGMGEVYRVRDDKLERDIALKLIRPSPFSNAGVRGKREIGILKTLNHDNIVGLLGQGTWQGQTYFTMDYVEGLSLSALLAKIRVVNPAVPAWTVADLMAPLVKGHTLTLLGGPLGDLTPEAPAYFAAIRIVQQIAVALSYLHPQAIFHRDVKPSNILLKSNGRALLTDFGIARVSRTPGGGDLTEAESFLGTDRYAAPEQHRGARVDARAVVYGLGAVLYELVCRARIFDDIENPRELIAAVLTRPPKPPILLAPEIPPALNHAILKALAREPEQRFSSALEFAQTLQRIIAPPKPGELARARQRSWRIVETFFAVGLASSIGTALAVHYHDALTQLNLPHPLFGALIPLAIGLGAGLLLGGFSYMASGFWALVTRIINR